MTIILRQITRRAAGGDIIRTQEIESDELTIGRGTDCTIQLSDLSVSLNHARLRMTGPRNVTIEAIGKLEFSVSGKFVSRADLTVDRTPVVAIGDFNLSLQPGEQSDQIVITIGRSESSDSASAEISPRKVFSLREALFSSRHLSWASVAAILVLSLAAPIVIFFLMQNHLIDSAPRLDKQWSSGPLQPGHHFLENDCQACHQQAFVAVRDEACLSCHEAGLNQTASNRIVERTRLAGSPFAPVAAQDHAPSQRLERARVPPTDIGGRITNWVSQTFNHPNDRCVSCHVEHAGTGQAVSNAAPPQVTTKDVAQVNCVDCHATMSKRLTDTQLPDVPDWGHHAEFRPNVTTAIVDGRAKVQQVSLAANPQERSGLKFPHRVHLEATGGVARLAMELGAAKGYGAPLTCSNCHRDDANRTGFLAVDMTRDCSSCHSLAFARRNGVLQYLPHGEPEKVVEMLTAYYAGYSGQASEPGEFLWRPGRDAGADVIDASARIRNAVTAVFSTGGTCFGCHEIVPSRSPDILSYGVVPVHLTQRYFPYAGFSHGIAPHRQDDQGAATCTSCHRAQASQQSQDILMPRLSDCATCHGNETSQATISASADCAMCHGYHDTGRPAALPADVFISLKP